MVILIILMFVVVKLPAILDLQTSFAIDTSPLLLFGLQNMHANTHNNTFLCALNNEV